MKNGHIPTKNESSRPLKRSYLENPYLCTLATTLFRIIYTFWGVVFDFCSSCRLVGRKECRINRCLAGHPGVLMAAVPILGTKFAFGGPFWHLPQRQTLIGSLILCPLLLHLVVARNSKEQMVLVNVTITQKKNSYW